MDEAAAGGDAPAAELTLAALETRPRAEVEEIATSFGVTDAAGLKQIELVYRILQVQAERQGNTNPNSSVGASLGFELPVAWRNQGERAVARSQAQAAELERELTEHAIEREVAAAYLRLEAALSELALLEQRAVPAAERTLAMVDVMREAGAIDYFRVLSARRDVFALRARRVDALREAWLSRIALERGVGGDLEVAR